MGESSGIELREARGGGGRVRVILRGWPSVRVLIGWEGWGWDCPSVLVSEDAPFGILPSVFDARGEIRAFDFYSKGSLLLGAVWCGISGSVASIQKLRGIMACFLFLFLMDRALESCRSLFFFFFLVGRLLRLTPNVEWR